VIECGHVSGLYGAAFHFAAGRYGDARIWSKSLSRAVAPLDTTGFPDPDLIDHLSIQFTSTSQSRFTGSGQLLRY
jgi:hypothetical protein